MITASISAKNFFIFIFSFSFTYHKEAVAFYHDRLIIPNKTAIFKCFSHK